MLTRLSQIPIWAIYLALVAACLVIFMFAPYNDVFEAGLPVQDPGRAVIETLREISKLIITVNTAMIGAAAALAVKGKDWSSRWGRMESVLTTLVFICGAVSYFGAYVCQVRLLSMLNVGTVNVFELGLFWSIRFQYLSVVLGVILLGLTFVLMLQARKPGA